MRQSRAMNRLRTVLLVVLVLSCAAPARQRSVPAPRPGTTEAAFQRASAELYEAYFAQVPAAPFSGALGVALGMHAYDGRPRRFAGRAAAARHLPG